VSPHLKSKERVNYLPSNIQWQQMTLAYGLPITFHTKKFANYGRKDLHVDENENKY